MSHCKNQVARRRQICNNHTKKWEIFFLKHLEHLMRDNIDININERVNIRYEQWRPRRLETNEVIQEPNKLLEESERILLHDMGDT